MPQLAPSSRTSWTQVGCDSLAEGARCSQGLARRDFVWIVENDAPQVIYQDYPEILKASGLG